ncbi:hypothetical protein [Metabacillus sp. 84]|uniref:hypothetical protein n=1 Tax=unclassified Metabacillus TaxID=2675274 RepID=UPI003CF19A50
MLKKSNGFSLLESIASFSIWCMAVLTLLPGVVGMLQERENISLETDAYRVLQSHTAERMTGAFKKNDEEGSGPYTIISSDGHSCIHWKDARQKEQEFCMQIH